MASDQDKTGETPSDKSSTSTGYPDAFTNTKNAGSATPGKTLRDDDDRHETRDANPDAITGAPGSHPIGTGIGAAGAGAAGAAIGTAVAGPAGTVAGGVIGAVVGAVAGGLAGKGAAEALNPTDEDAYWRENHRNASYYTPGSNYDDYASDYRHGYEGTTRYEGRSYDEAEHDLRRDWEAVPSNAGRSWDRAKHAVRDAFNRVHHRNRTNRNA